MSRSRNRRLSLGLLIGLASAWGSGRADAKFVPSPPPPPVTVADPNFQYEIPLTLTQFNDMISPATGPNSRNPIVAATDDYLTFYNIAGFLSFIGVYADKAETMRLNQFNVIDKDAGSGYVPPGTTPPAPIAGDADISVYELPGFAPITNTTLGTDLIGYLVFQTRLPNDFQSSFDYGSQDHNNGVIQTATGTIHTVPEPASLGLVLLGSALAGRLLHARRRTPACGDPIST